MAYFDNLNSAQHIVWKDRFQAKDENGYPMENSIYETFSRVAKELAKPEKDPHWQIKFYEVISNGLFMPGGRILSNIGTRNNNGFNCFVIPVKDDLASIFDSIKEMALVQQRGGGTGFTFSDLRPKGEYAKTSHSHSSGPCSFISAFNMCSNVIQSGSRRAANMGILSIYHPDIEEFIEYKRLHPGDWERFNVSVDVDQKFIDAVKNDGDHVLSFNGKTYKVIKARYLWDLLCKNAWEYGDPGIIDLEMANKDFNYEFFMGSKVVATNPCLTGDCKLLTNYGYQKFEELVKYKNNFTNLKVFNGKSFEEGTVFESGTKETITLVTKSGQSISCTPDHLLLTCGHGWKKAHECFGLKLEGIVHGGSVVTSIAFSGIKKVYDFRMEVGEPQGVVDSFIVHNCSEQILHPYDQCCLGSVNLVSMIDNPWSVNPSFNTLRFKDTIRTAIRMLDNVYDVTTFPLPQNKEFGMKFRRVGLGIMGYADLCYILGVKYSKSQNIANQIMEQMAYDAFEASCDLAIEKGKNDIDSYKYVESPYFLRNLSRSLVEKIKNNGVRNMNVLSIAPTGTIAMLSDVSSGIEPVFSHSYTRKDALTYEAREVNHSSYAFCKSKENFDELNECGIFETAHDINPEEHIDIHGQFASYVDTNISKTCNLPHYATVEDVSNIFMKAREFGIKSTTVYRDGSRNQVLNIVSKEICPSCSGELQSDQNCKSCSSCGWSACTI